MQKLSAIIKETANEAENISLDCAAVNVRRIFYGALAVMTINLALIIVFLLSKPNGEIELIWNRGIIITHSAMFVLMGAAFLTAFFLRRREKQGLTAYLLQYFACFTLMAAGIVLVSFDQLVSTNITPFLIVCVIVGSVFLIRPVYSFIIFVISFAVYYFAIALAPNSYDVIFSNRVNGLSSVVIGFVLSFITWRTNLLRLRQSQFIDLQQRELEEMAYMDPLTGLPNRRRFDSVINQEVSLALNSPRKSSLLMLDIDLFKEINDRYGHPFGDRALIQIGALLSANIRKGDTLCRLGGEEFIILLPDTLPVEAAAVAEKLRAVIEGFAIYADDMPVRFTASFGVASLDYSLDPTLINQYSRVDKALYLAKRKGKNRVITV